MALKKKKGRLMHPDVTQLHKLAHAPLGATQEPSNGTGFLKHSIRQIQRLIQQYVDFEAPQVATIIACWIIQTYCFELFRYCGYLSIKSATPRSGKTRLLQVVALLAVGTPPITTLPTAATLFRSSRKVLLLDEVDRLRNIDKDKYGEVLGVLNSGFEQDGMIERCESGKGSGYDVKTYHTYGPKAFAGLENLADTLTDRSFQILMKRAAKRMPRFNNRRLQVMVRELREQVACWIAQHQDTLKRIYEDLPDELPHLQDFDDRFQDIAEPLVVLAMAADDELPDELRLLDDLLTALRHCAGQREVSTREYSVLALLDLVRPRLESTPTVFVPTTDILELCHEHEGLAWIESGKRLAGFLKHFGLCPTTDGKRRGYTFTKAWVEDCASRYACRTESVS